MSLSDAPKHGDYSVRTEVWKGPLVAVYPDGRRFSTERDVIIVDDWRDTIFGLINVGHVRLLPTRTVELT